MPIASAYMPPAVYNLLVTFITGGVSMVIFFFVFKIIFSEGEKRSEKDAKGDFWQAAIQILNYERKR